MPMLFAKNYQNQSMLVETTACQSWRVFMRHSVVTLVGEKSRTSLHVKVTDEGHFQRVPVIRFRVRATFFGDSLVRGREKSWGWRRHGKVRVVAWRGNHTHLPVPSPSPALLSPTN